MKTGGHRAPGADTAGHCSGPCDQPRLGTTCHSSWWGRAGRPHAGADSSQARFITVLLPAPKRWSSGGGDRAGAPPSPPSRQPLPLPAAPAGLCGQSGGQGSAGTPAAPGPAALAWGAQPLSLCCAGEKPPQIVTITFAGDLHAGAAFTEEQ